MISLKRSASDTAWILCCSLTLANNEDPDKMSQNEAFHQGLDCMPGYKPDHGL